MKRIGLISDTHSYLDEGIVKAFESCDEIWHAGDIGSVELADTLASLKTFRAVYGNIDGGALRRMFPLDDVFECEGLKVWMTHIGGYPGRYPARIAQGIKNYQPGLFICGHSHILKVMPDKQNLLLHMNPGAAGQHGFHIFRTILRFSVSEGKITDLEAVELGKRGKIDTL
ncbi:MAG: metallophosphoesterase family protein [Bacteroidia bacterium]